MSDIKVGERIKSIRVDDGFSSITGWRGTVIEPDSAALEYIEPGEFVVQYDEDTPATHGFYERYDEEGVNWERIND